MATVFKETFTKALPTGADVFTRKGEQFARWTDGRGKAQTAKVTVPKKGKYAGQMRIVQKAGTYTAKYRDGTGVVRKMTTGCRDEGAARNVLAELVKRAENVKSGITTAAQDAVIDHQGTPMSEHVDAYLTFLATKTIHGRTVSDAHRENVTRNLRRIVAECGFIRLAQIDRSAVESWMERRGTEGMGARTRNTHRAAIVAFANWCVETRRLAVNPLARLCKADEKGDCRRQRRALTEQELEALLDNGNGVCNLFALREDRGSHEHAASESPDSRSKDEVVSDLFAKPFYQGDCHRSQDG